MKPTPQEIDSFITTLKLERCAQCGFALSGDPMTVNAIYSCMIENPRIEEYFCRCEKP